MSVGTGLDAGHHRVRLAQLKSKKGAFQLQRYHSVEVVPNETPMEAASAAFSRLSKKPSPARLGLTGSDLMLRYLPVPPVEDWRLERLMEFEVRELESRSGAPLATSFNLLPVPKELDEEDTILLGLVREDLLEQWLEALGKLPVQGFTPNAIALYNAYLALGDHEPSVTLLANIGATTLDLALVRGTDLYFARSITAGLEKRDQTLADQLGIDARRAQKLVHKHLDLRLATGARLESDADRVTRPLMAVYDPIPTLLGSMVTLCKAQARLRDLALDRILITGGGAKAIGLSDLLTERLRVPTSVWNPVEMVDAGELGEDQYSQLEEDGPGATIALGLALSAADSDLYALEILPKAARKKRDFQERGVFAVIAAVLAVAFLVFKYVHVSGAATTAAQEERQVKRLLTKANENQAKADSLLTEVQQKTKLVDELTTRYALRRSAAEVYSTLTDWMPENLWVESFFMELQEGKQWGFEGEKSVPVVTVRGRGQDSSRQARTVFNDFVTRLKEEIPGGEASIRETTQMRGRDLDWTITAHLLFTETEEGEDEE